MSFFSHLECPACGKTYPRGPGALLCHCGSPLLARYDLERIAATVPPGKIASRRPDLWRYAEFLPVSDPAAAVTLGEGFTPLLPLRRLGEGIGLPHLLLKDEGRNPTGTFKARGAAVGVSMAREHGVTAVGVPTAGNAGGAWSAYAARAGITCTVAMPSDAPALAVYETVLTGAATYLVDGIITDAGRIIGDAVRRYRWLDATTLKEPYRVEGKKTMGLEIAEQLGWRVPDVIIYPCGGGVGLIGIYKALRELQGVGWIGPEMPRLVAVQAEGCAPVVRAVEARAPQCTPFEHPQTIAGGLRVPSPLGGRLILDAIYSTGGTAVGVSDNEILESMRRICATEGLLVCPEGAAALAAAVRLRAAGWIQEDEQVLLLNTGSGLKYPGLVEVAPPVLGRDGRI